MPPAGGAFGGSDLATGSAADTFTAHRGRTGRTRGHRSGGLRRRQGLARGVRASRWLPAIRLPSAGARRDAGLSGVASANVDCGTVSTAIPWERVGAGDGDRVEFAGVEAAGRVTGAVVVVTVVATLVGGTSADGCGAGALRAAAGGVARDALLGVSPVPVSKVAEAQDVQV